MENKRLVYGHKKSVQDLITRSSIGTQSHLKHIAKIKKYFNIEDKNNLTGFSEDNKDQVLETFEYSSHSNELEQEYKEEIEPPMPSTSTN